jgi:hypothetical protein
MAVEGIMVEACPVGPLREMDGFDENNNFYDFTITGNAQCPSKSSFYVIVDHLQIKQFTGKYNVEDGRAYKM